MPRNKGNNSFWMKIKSIQDFEEKYIGHIVAHIEDALKIKHDNLYNGSDNLKAGAANFYVSEYTKLAKAYKNTTPEDCISKQRRRSRIAKPTDQQKKLITLDFNGTED